MGKEEYMEFEYSVIFRLKVDAKNIPRESLGTQNLAVFAMWCDASKSQIIRKGLSEIRVKFSKNYNNNNNNNNKKSPEKEREGSFQVYFPWLKSKDKSLHN